MASRPVPGRHPGPGRALGELLRHYWGRLALCMALDLAEAFGYYSLFALLSVVVLKQVEIGHAQVPFIVLDRLGRHRTVASFTLAAAGLGLLSWATATGSAVAVTVAFVVTNAFATAA